MAAARATISSSPSPCDTSFVPSGKLLNDPAIDLKGHTYERDAMLEVADADVPSGHELPSTTTTTTVRSTKEGKEGGNLPELLKRHADHDEKSHSIHFFGCCFNFAEEG
eukprot:CAMPEP_0181084748 /NCGR_PEP_ID=MMETSP1071-20121207/4860_1 /TAXON_ID=35127 /ORGANISM="Thalassiosira sp., Strain NH16" /LENGTH=108 /DNA_ID=CAMNT_0023166501 /DNA_START=151 /DNA_END=473 /DNA_ORIENTATION=+